MMSSKEAPPSVPTGNLRIAARIRHLLRRDYFYTEQTRPSGGNPLLLNVTGYLALLMVLEVLLGYYFTLVQTDVGSLGYHVTELTFAFFSLSFVLHLVLWIVGSLWRITNGHATLST